MSDLIKRLDEYLEKFQIRSDEYGYMCGLLYDCREALSKEYVPMTDDELVRHWRRYGEDSMHGLRGLQKEFIKRAGLTTEIGD